VTLGELAVHWLTQALGCEDAADVRPRLALSPSYLARAAAIVRTVRQRTPFVVAANLGVGGNPRKRIPGEFELNVVRALLSEGSAVILDHGAGEDEVRVQAIVAAVRRDGRSVHEIAGSDFSSAAAADCDVLAYRGPVGPFAALTGASDLYVGYDSAFQHIAAAQGVSVVDIFVDPPNPVFPRRWRPHSSAGVTVIDTAFDDSQNASVDRVADAHRRSRRAALRR
jgi:ADP-heptose:LPS heptosyltransferase